MLELNTSMEHLPDEALKQSINWLNSVAQDCRHKISTLESILDSRKNTRNYRERLSDLAEMFADEDFLNHSEHNQIAVVMQRLGCNHKRAKDLIPLIRRRIKTKKQQQTEKAIMILLETTKLNQPQIAEQVGCTRQNVSKIVKKLKGDRFFQ